MGNCKHKEKKLFIKWLPLSAALDNSSNYIQTLKSCTQTHKGKKILISEKLSKKTPRNVLSILFDKGNGGWKTIFMKAWGIISPYKNSLFTSSLRKVTVIIIMAIIMTLVIIKIIIVTICKE